MRTLLRLIGVVMIGGAVFGIPHIARTQTPLTPIASPHQPWQSKVDPWVIQTAEAGQTEFLVFLKEQADLSQAAALRSKQEKGAYVYKQLTETARRAQKPLLPALSQLGVDYYPYWVANMIWVRGSLSVIQSLAQRPDVAHVYANPAVQVEMPVIAPQANESLAEQTIQWNILKVNADDVWALGYTGQEAVIAGQDTGYDWDHPALINQYRGWDGATADHDYNWHDAIHANNPLTSPDNPCGFNSPVPCDDDNHGTHTMGTMVGDDGDTNKIGMAPGARWIGCRNMEEGWGTPATYAECYQWFIAPTRIDGSQPRPDLAPDVINNSWGCPVYEGCTDPNVLLTVVNNVRAAGIVTAHSAGNSGSDCTSVNTPAAIYDASFTVGATDSSDNIAGFSSRGPVSVDGSNRLKPNVSAPGVSIYSSIRGGFYQNGILWSGTSMAAPHVSGLVALLLSTNPNLRGQVDAIENLIERSAVPRTTTQECGSVPGSNIPNNTYGWGRIDAYAALQQHYLSIKKTPSEWWVSFGSVLTYTLSVQHTAGITNTTNVLLTDTLPADTTFITATLPHIRDGDTLRWEFPSLAPAESRSVELTIQMPVSGTIQVKNLFYGVRSDQVAPPTMGAEVTTLVGYHQIFPFIIKK